MATSELAILVSVKDQASQAMQGISSSLKGMETQFKAVAAVGGAIFAATTGVAITSLNAFAEAEKAMTVATSTLDNTIETMSVNSLNMLQDRVGEGVDIFKAMHQQMGLVSKAAIQLGFDDEEAAAGFAKLFSITKDAVQAEKEMKIAFDLAAFSGRSVEEAVSALTMVHAGGTRVLKEFGIAVAEGTTAEEAFALVQERTQGTAEKLTTTLDGQMRILNVQLGNLRENIGGALVGAVNGLFMQLQPVVDKIVEWSENNPEFVQRIIIAGIAVGGLLAVIGGLGLILPAVITGMGLLLSPIVLVAGAIAGIIVAVIVFREKLMELLLELDANTGVVTYLKDSWNEIVEVFNYYLLPALQQLWDSFQPFKPFLEFLAKLIGGALVIALYAFITGMKWIIELAVAFIAAWAAVQTWINEKLIPIFNAARDAVMYVVDAVYKLIDAFAKLNIVQGATKFVGSVLGGASKMLGLAEGGIVTSPTIAMIGEGGEPEAVIPLSKLGGIGGGGTTININGGTYLSESAAGELGDMILNKLKMNMRM